ncbi:MAG: S1-like domain-containing RNA-binding protein [Verrucomicrobiota bacterium]
MAQIGERTSLRIVREKPPGLYLDGGELGEVLLPRREMPNEWEPGGRVEVFIYLDSEDRQVATTLHPKAMPGQFARLRVVALTPVGAFLDWGLSKDLLVPFREQKTRMEIGNFYLVYVRVDEASNRIIATTRLARHLDLTPHTWREGEAVDLIIYGKTELGYKAIINGSHSGLLFANEVFQKMQPGERVKGYIASVRLDGKIDLSLHAPGRARVDGLEAQILAELEARGGFWALCDSSSADEIHRELGVSKRTFKQAAGALLRQHKITLADNGMRLVQAEAD